MDSGTFEGTCTLAQVELPRALYFGKVFHLRHDLLDKTFSSLGERVPTRLRVSKLR